MMNLKGILYYVGLFCFPISFLSFLNILYSSYFDYFLNIESYLFTLVVSITFGSAFCFASRKSDKRINFYEQLFLIIIIYFITSLLISIPYYLSNYQITFINSIFEAFSGVTGTGFSIFENIKYLDPTLILWRSSSQWVGGLYFLVFLLLFFSNSQFNYKLNNLVFTGDKSLNPDSNIKKISIKVFFLYTSLTFLIFLFFSISEVRLFNGLNLSMTLISAGGFLPTNSLNQIIKTNTQEVFLILSLLVSMTNIFFIYNIFSNKNFFKDHYEDFFLIFLAIILSLILLLSSNNLNLSEVLVSILSSINNSGITTTSIQNNFSLYLLFLTIAGGSILSNSSGIKFLRIYILLKASFAEIFKLVRPNNVIKQNILYSDKTINNEHIKMSFIIFISFFISLFFLSGILILDNINFENSFKLSILTLTNTTEFGLYGLTSINFANLLTSSKIFLIIFMIIGKIELISILLIFRKILFKN